MTEPVYDYYATRIVQDLEDDLYDSKERIQRLRRQNDELAAENERLREGVEELADWVRKVMNANIDRPQYIAALTPIWCQVSDLLEGETE